MPYCPQYLSPTWSCYYFLQSVTRCPVLHTLPHDLTLMGDFNLGIEHVWCRNPTALNRSRLTWQVHFGNRQVSKAKLHQYSKIILSTLIMTSHYARYLTKSGSKCKFLIWSSIVAVANTFSSFFISKISAIHPSFPVDSHSCALIPPDSHSRALILLDTMKFLQSLTCVAAYGMCCLVLPAPCKS